MQASEFFPLFWLFGGNRSWILTLFVGPSVYKIITNSQISFRRAVRSFRFLPRDCVITQAVWWLRHWGVFSSLPAAARGFSFLYTFRTDSRALPLSYLTRIAISPPPHEGIAALVGIRQILTVRGPCMIYKYSYNKSQRDTLISHHFIRTSASR